MQCLRCRFGQPWDEGQNHSSGSSQDHANPEQTGVDSKIESADRKARYVMSQYFYQWLSTPQRQHRAATTKQKALGQQHSTERALTCAHCCADRQLALAANGARQNEIRDIGTRNDEQ